MQLGFSGHGEPATARWSTVSWVLLASWLKKFSESVSHFSGLFSQVPPKSFGRGSVDIFAAPARTCPSFSEDGLGTVTGVSAAARFVAGVAAAAGCLRCFVAYVFLLPTTVAFAFSCGTG